MSQDKPLRLKRTGHLADLLWRAVEAARLTWLAVDDVMRDEDGGFEASEISDEALAQKALIARQHKGFAVHFDHKAQSGRGTVMHRMGRDRVIAGDGKLNGRARAFFGRDVVRHQKRLVLGAIKIAAIVRERAGILVEQVLSGAPEGNPFEQTTNSVIVRRNL